MGDIHILKQTVKLLLKLTSCYLITNIEVG